MKRDTAEQIVCWIIVVVVPFSILMLIGSNTICMPSRPIPLTIEPTDYTFRPTKPQPSSPPYYKGFLDAKDMERLHESWKQRENFRRIEQKLDDIETRLHRNDYLR